jgi:cellulose synthase/poly-beta-1,6-N-acetylglucosamine synthase-like glycosyltransferase
MRQQEERCAMAPALIWLIMFLCLLITVVKYTLGAILKFSVPDARIIKDYSYQPTVSVILPCYNEGNDFRNQLTTTQLLLQIETGDAGYRIQELQNFLNRNY